MKKFEDLSLKGQKMRIVKDALVQIKLKNFTPLNGLYLRFLGDNNNIYFPKGNESIQKTLKEKSCECCAKGALFASCVLNVNKVYGSQHLDDEPFQKKKLRKWFEPLELDMMETAFELRVIGESKYIGLYNFDTMEIEYTDLGKQCLKFGKKYKSSKTRLVSILSNILKNGEFKP